MRLPVTCVNFTVSVYEDLVRRVRVDILPPIQREPLIRLCNTVGSISRAAGLISPGKRQISVPGGGSTLTHHYNSEPKFQR